MWPLKARDVVAGWPRGRSTSRPYRQGQGELPLARAYRAGQQQMVDWWHQGFVEARTTAKVMEWEPWLGARGGHYYSYLLPREGTGSRELKMWTGKKEPSRQ
jgi:hypothetical protein